MLAPPIKKNVDKLWNLFWTAGITNPLVAVEQITYLLFLKRLEGIDNARVNDGRASIYTGTIVRDGKETEVDYGTCRWSYIEQDRSPAHLIEVVFPWLRDLEKHFGAGHPSANGIDAIGARMSDAYFQLDPNKSSILQQAIELINKLFARVDTQGAATDVLGDTFEYLLSEIATAGKNGQFRTPRHIIRSMVAIVDPQPSERIIDPAAGTGGFLFSSLNHILAQYTEPELLRIEWDGTPHRVYGNRFSAEEFAEVHEGRHYVGLDNDRTMVRIGWMNMILHGIENPQIHQCDSLGRRRDDDPLRDSLASESYDIVLSNPPFTGTVDAADLDGAIFPKAGTRGKKASQVVSNKSELLFVWRMLDLLSVGGRCAVIVPEGVLFGNTDGHVRLRRELLTEHRLEAVISLPAGVFQPYTAVKTSMLVFRKETRKEDRNQWQPVDLPRTGTVWFYEVAQEAFTLDARRNERRGQHNDLWDMLAKYPLRDRPDQAGHDYFQPDYSVERWRMVDAHTLRVFSGEAEVSRWKDQVAAIGELFDDLPPDPKHAFEQTDAAQKPRLDELARGAIGASVAKELARARTPRNAERRDERAERALKHARTAFRSLCDRERPQFDRDDGVAYPLYRQACTAAADAAIDALQPRLAAGEPPAGADRGPDGLQDELAGIAREYARLDGYDVMLRGLDSLRREGALKEPKHWAAPVRVYAEHPDWESEDGALKGSHDGQAPRPEYLAGLRLYDDRGRLAEGLLDPDCIEARGWNLSASQYKPFNFEAVVSDTSVVQTIRELKRKEGEIIEGLDRLLAMVDGS